MLSLSEHFCFDRFALHKIEQELATEIKPIPKIIDTSLYVAEAQQVDPDVEEEHYQQQQQQLLQRQNQQPRTNSSHQQLAARGLHPHQQQTVA